MLKFKYIILYFERSLWVPVVSSRLKNARLITQSHKSRFDFLLHKVIHMWARGAQIRTPTPRHADPIVDPRSSTANQKAWLGNNKEEKFCSLLEYRQTIINLLLALSWQCSTVLNNKKHPPNADPHHWYYEINYLAVALTKTRRGIKRRFVVED